MHSPRRDFIRAALVTSAGLAIGGRALGQVPTTSSKATEPTKAAKQLKILILGGTGFLGPACTEAILARGHSLTIFNRGRLETIRKERGLPGVVPEGVEVLYGNRDPEKFAEDWKDDPNQNSKGLEKKSENPKGLSQLVGKSWDAVIDTSGYFPRMAKASADLLAPNVKQYVFISTLSVYADTSKPITEDTPLATLADPTTEDFGPGFANYGPGKAACEKVIEDVMPGKVTNIRPGFIVGRRDTSSRFLFWPLRIRRGGEMLLPGSPDDPIQIIDVRDLASWIVHCIEHSIVGVYNATGPATTMTMKALAEGCAKGCNASTAFHWATFETLKGLGNAKDGQPLFRDNDFPLYVPPSGEGAGFHKCDVSKALAKGLTLRPIDDTARSTLAWYDTLSKEVQAGITKFDLSEERQDEMLHAWKAHK